MKTLKNELCLNKTTIQLLDDESLVNVRGGKRGDTVIIGSNTCADGDKSCCKNSCYF